MTRYIITGLIAALSVLGSEAASAQSTDIETIEQISDIETIEKPQPEPDFGPGIGPVTVLQPAGLVFVGYDSTHDYRITRDELHQGQQRSFVAADKNQDQTLSLFELEDWRLMALGHKDAMPGALQFDTDFNRVISPEEFASELERLFDALDRNNDNVLIASELVRVAERKPKDTRPPSLLNRENTNRPYSRPY